MEHALPPHLNYFFSFCFAVWSPFFWYHNPFPCSYHCPSSPCDWCCYPGWRPPVPPNFSSPKWPGSAAVLCTALLIHWACRCLCPQPPSALCPGRSELAPWYCVCLTCCWKPQPLGTLWLIPIFQAYAVTQESFLEDVAFWRTFEKLALLVLISLSPSMPLFFTALSQFLAVASNFPLAVLVACYAHAAHVQFPAGLFSSWLLSWSLVFAFSVSLMVCSLSLALLLSSKSMWLLLLYG